MSVVTDEVREALTRDIPLHRMGKPDEVANAALFLASDESSYIAGQRSAWMAEWLRFDGVFPLHSHLRMAVFARGVSPALLANHLFPRYTPFTHQLTGI